MRRVRGTVQNMPTHDETIENIREEIQKRENCRAVHVKSVQITTVLTDEFLLRFRQPIQINTETFQLVGLATASVAYGWQLTQRTRDEAVRIIVQLQTQRISSPKAAVDEWAKDLLKS